MKDKPIILNAFSNGKALTPSSVTFQGVVESIQNAASGATRWKVKGDASYYLYKKESGQTLVEFRGDVNVLDDYHADILLAVMAQSVHVAGSYNPCWFSAKQFLDIRGLTKTTKQLAGRTWKSGYRVDDMKGIVSRIQQLSYIWLHIQLKNGYTYNGPLFTIEDVYPLNKPSSWKIQTGDWMQECLKKPHMVMYLNEKTLQYDYYHELWKKRLSRYFMFHSRMTTNRSGKLIRHIGRLMNDVSLPINQRHGQRTKQPFEEAMDALVEDGYIKSWAYQEQIELPPRNWLPRWLDLQIVVFAPKRLVGIDTAPSSPIEQAFSNAWESITEEDEEMLLSSQYSIGRYRVDFAHVKTKTAIELDGFATHSSTKDIASDRKRQRWIEDQGWYVLRFGGKEIHEDVNKCVAEAYKVLQRRLNVWR